MLNFRFPAATLVGVLCALLALASAAKDYPIHPLRIIVPYAPGAGVDIVARLIAPKLGERLGQAVIVENRTGAGAIVGTQAVAKSEPDGYTLLLADAGPLAINPAINTQLRYNPQKDFAPVILLATLPTVLVANPNLGVSNLAELLDLARKRPGQINYASAGNGTSTHLAMELLRSQAGVQLVHIPYAGTAPALVGVLAGDPSLMFANLLSCGPLIAQGRLRALAIANPKRSPAMPDLPTLAEGGLPGFQLQSWFGIVVPAGTPQPIIARLNAEFNEVLQLPEIRQRLMEQGGMEPIGGTPADFATVIAKDLVTYGRIVKEAGIKEQ
jgi:tripartite-type tricarboxylate transporter receptor subunit TctC